jgi:hypothetical protein
MEKFNLFLFTLSCLFLVREIYMYIQSAMKNRTLIDTDVSPYSIPIIRLIGLWISIGFIITTLILGFK